MAAMPGATAFGQESLSAPAADGALCSTAIQVTEREARLPAKLLGAIGVVESGRVDPATGRVVPWPWTINVGGVGHFYATKPEAVAAVEAARAAGQRSIDVGCMQVNLAYHPAAFATLDEAFDPAANTAYAARFLGQLFRQTADWGSAAAAYHSSTPEIGAAYGRRVMALTPLPPGQGMAAARLTPAMLARKVDPNNIYTPAFRASLVLSAMDEATRLAAWQRLPARSAASRSGMRR